MCHPITVFSRSLVKGENPSPVLSDLMRSLGGFKDKVSPGDTVLIKPNLVAPFEKATTDLSFIEFVLDQVRGAGAVPVIGESSGFEFDTEVVFDILGIRRFAEDRGVRLINFEKGKYASVDLGADLRNVEVCEAALNARLVVNLPVLKRHKITKVTGAVKNFFGFLSKGSRRRIHHQGLNEGIRALAGMFAGAIHIVDARSLLTTAVFGEETPLGFCFAGFDPFALDHFGAGLIGVDPAAIGYMKEGLKYAVSGHLPEEVPALSKGDSWKERFYRTIYSSFYWLDDLKCSLLGGDSIIPYLHWHLGIHPEIGRVTEEERKALSSLCPVGAIDVEKGDIVRSRCYKVRCLKCYNRDKPERIRLRGYNLPGTKKRSGYDR
jgi:uncharacterized protein (DUF362 family)